jgi:hypothetical protein
VQCAGQERDKQMLGYKHKLEKYEEGKKINHTNGIRESQRINKKQTE